MYCLFYEQCVQITDEAVFSNKSNKIKEALKNVQIKNQPKTGISATAFEIALNQLN